MAKKTPTVNDNILRIVDTETDRLQMEIHVDDKPDWKHWQAFLEQNKSFRYVHTTPQGFKLSFTAVKEKRANGPYWYAHKRVDGKLKRRYLGANRNLTAEKLKEIALSICQATLV